MNASTEDLIVRVLLDEATPAEKARLERLIREEAEVRAHWQRVSRSGAWLEEMHQPGGGAGGSEPDAEELPPFYRHQWDQRRAELTEKRREPAVGKSSPGVWRRLLQAFARPPAWIGATAAAALTLLLIVPQLRQTQPTGLNDGTGSGAGVDSGVRPRGDGGSGATAKQPPVTDPVTDAPPAGAAVGAVALLAPTGPLQARMPIRFLWSTEPQLTYDFTLHREGDAAGADGAVELAPVQMFQVRPPLAWESLGLEGDEANGPLPGRTYRWTVRIHGDHGAPTPRGGEGETEASMDGAGFVLDTDAPDLTNADDTILLKAVQAAEAAERYDEALLLLLATSDDALSVAEFVEWRGRLEGKLMGEDL